LAKHHRHKLAPAAEAFGMPFGFKPTHLSFKAMAID
jgi:hypothetical protein